jgi:hypothetical protein
MCAALSLVCIPCSHAHRRHRSTRWRLTRANYWLGVQGHFHRDRVDDIRPAWSWIRYINDNKGSYAALAASGHIISIESTSLSTWFQPLARRRSKRPA